MVAVDPLALVNSVLCAVIVLVLMFYQCEGARHRPLISWLAYAIILVYASIPFRFAFGLYESPSLLVIFVNTAICAVVLRCRGNVARIIDALRM